MTQDALFEGGAGMEQQPLIRRRRRNPTPMPRVPEVDEARALAARIGWLEKELNEARDERLAMIPRLRDAGCTWAQVSEVIGISVKRIEQIADRVNEQRQAAAEPEGEQTRAQRRAS